MAKHNLGIWLPYPIQNLEAFKATTIELIMRTHKVELERAKELLDNGINNFENKLKNERMNESNVSFLSSECVEKETPCIPTPKDEWITVDELCTKIAKHNIGKGECDYQQVREEVFEKVTKLIPKLNEEGVQKYIESKISRFENEISSQISEAV